MKLSVVFCAIFYVFSKSYCKGFHINNNNGPTSSSSVYYCYRQSLLRLEAAAKNNNITIMKESHSSKDHDNKNNDDDIILRQQRRNYNDNKSNHNYNNAWEEKWERTFDELQNYVYKNGMQLPHSRHRLRFWFYRQEKMMKRIIMEQNNNNNNNSNNVVATTTSKSKVMTLERAQRLRDFKESIIVMKKPSRKRKRRKWDDWFESVLDYVEINKCLPTKSSTKRSDSSSTSSNSTSNTNFSPEEEEEDPSSLYNWLVRQIKILDRMEKNNDPVTTKKRSLLTDEKIHRLKTLLEKYPEFLTTTKNTATTPQEKRMKWNEWFERVLDYVDRNECLPPKPIRGTRGSNTTTTNSSSSSLYNWLVRQIKILQRIENDPNFVSRSLDDEKNVHRLKTLLEQYPNHHLLLDGGDTQDILWERKFKQVQKFINIHGHLPTPSLHFQLYSWIYYHQKLLERIEKKKKNDSKITTTTTKAMTKERMERLRKLLGSSCYKNYAASIQEGWEEKYMELKDFIQSHGGRTPKQGENHVLYHWLYRQKKKMTTTSSNDNDNGRFLLTKEREERLKDLLDQCVRSKDKWEERFSELEAYVNEHDKLPPSRHSLYPWLFNQRKHARSWTTKASKVAKSTVLTEERLDRLAKLTGKYEEKKAVTPNNSTRGATQPRQEMKAMEVHVISWETIFEELKGFLGTHGRLPTVRENERLHKWLYRQKRHMANREQNEKFPATLTDERVHRLKSLIDGDNALSAMEVAWEERFRELKEFVETNGTYPTCYSNISLYDWVRRQKRLCEQFERDPALSSSRLMVGDRARRFAAFIDEYEKKYQNTSTGI